MKKEDKQSIQKHIDESNAEILKCFQEEDEKRLLIDAQAKAAEQAIDEALEKEIAKIQEKSKMADEILRLINLEMGIDKEE